MQSSIATAAKDKAPRLLVEKKSFKKRAQQQRIAQLHFVCLRPIGNFDEMNEHRSYVHFGCFLLAFARTKPFTCGVIVSVHLTIAYYFD